MCDFENTEMGEIMKQKARQRGRILAERKCGLLFILIGLSACQGIIDDPGGPMLGHGIPGVTPNPPGDLPPEVAARFACDPAGPQTMERSLRRLSHRELEGAISRLFGDRVGEDVETSLEGLPREGVALFDTSFRQDDTAEFMEAAFRVMSTTAESAVQGSALDAYRSCESADDLEGGCLLGLIENLGLRMFRRPLEPDEAAHYADVAQGPWLQPIATMLTSMLLSPAFLYHLEQGAPEGSVVELNPFEIASRLSFMIEDSVPDDELMGHALAGTLHDEVLRGQIARMLGSERGRTKLLTFFRRWVRITSVPSVDASSAFMGDIDAATFTDESLAEFDRYVEYVVYEKRGGFEDLILGDEVFPHTEQLAEFYGTPLWEEGDAPPSVAQARGLLLRPPTMISGSSETSPIIRGVLFLAEVMCEPIEFPGDDIIDARQSQEPDTTSLTVRERTAVMTSDATCASCHSRINPVGFALEELDSLGRFRFEENHFDGDEIVATYPVDAQVDGLVIDNSPVAIDGATELIEAIAQSSKVASCFARKYFRFANFRVERDNADECQMTRMYLSLAAGDGSILGLLAETYAEAVVSTRRVP